MLALLLFPFAVTESLPDWVANVDPLLFVATLAIPVLRYDLWAIDTLVRRSAAYTLAASGSVVENMMRAVAEMLRLPYVAVRREHGCAGLVRRARRPRSRRGRWSIRASRSARWSRRHGTG